MAVFAMMSASWALRPAHGSAEAWAVSPWKSASKPAHAIDSMLRHSLSMGWTIMARWVPSKSPCSSMTILPPPFSSAGVPSRRTVMPSSSASSASARKAPRPAVQMMLWPHAWPMSGSASNSEQMVTTRSPEPACARTAVGSSPTPWETSGSPAAVAASSASHAEVFTSSQPSSGFSCSRWDRPRS